MEPRGNVCIHTMHTQITESFWLEKTSKIMGSNPDAMCVGTTCRHSLKRWSITENERDVLVRWWMVLPPFLTSILIQHLTWSPSLMINEVLSCFLKLKNNTSSIYQRQSSGPWLTPILWSTSRGKKKKHQWVNSHSVMLGRAVIALKLSMSTADCKDHSQN